MVRLERTARRALWVGVLTLILAVGWLGSAYALRFFLDETAQRSESTLRLTVAGLRGALNRYRAVPELIADRREIRQLLASPRGAEPARQVSRLLRQISTVVGVSDIYVMDVAGLTLAASNFESATSFVGKNFSYRPYFQEAVAGGRGRYLMRRASAAGGIQWVAVCDAWDVQRDRAEEEAGTTVDKYVDYRKKNGEYINSKFIDISNTVSYTI